MLLLTLFFGCSSQPQDCPECPEPTVAHESQAESPSTPSPHSLSSWEAELLAEPLEDLRAGVRPFHPEGFGICRGIQRCEEFLGTDPGLLPSGDYMVYAELRVPQLGEGWSANFQLDCDIKREGQETRPYEYSRSYEVAYSGPNRGYRLAPMMRIKSAEPDGALRDCRYSLTPSRPDGEASEPLTGSYSTY